MRVQFIIIYKSTSLYDIFSETFFDIIKYKIYLPLHSRFQFSSPFLKLLLFIFLIQIFVWKPQIKLLSSSFIGSINPTLIMKTQYFV